MRIRKRQVLFSSSFSPLPLSDPHLNNRSPVVVQLGDATTTTAPKSSSTSVLPQHAAAASSLDRYQPSDQTLPPIGKPSNGYDDPSGIGESGTHRQHNKQDPLDEDVRGQESGDSGEKDNQTRKGSILGLEIQTGFLPLSSPSSTHDGRWCQEEKVIPLKKRRGSLSFDNMMENNATHDNDKKMKARMKTKMNKKCSTQSHENMEGEDEEGKEEDGYETKPDLNVSKKRARGSALMEGSRCSRVNGRGWRCCQQTLVGYSLCEHHLGKGRLRSMTSVRNRSIASTAPKNVKDMLEPSLCSSSSSSIEKQNKSDIDALDNNEKKPVIITKKRMKLGMVKARSISSLLGQTNTQVVVADENNK